MKQKSFLIPGLLIGAVVLVAAAGGGWFFLVHSKDPMKKGDALMAQGDPRAAQIEYRNAVRDNPNLAAAHLKLGQTQIALADPVAAERELKAARDLGADRWAILPLLGQVYMAQNRYREVLAEVPPDGPTPDIAAKNLMLRSMAQVGVQDLDGAQQSLELAQKIAPNNAEVLLTASRLALALKNVDVAFQKADEALKVDPTSTEALLMKSQILLFKGDRAGALEMTSKALDLNPNASPARLDRANQYIIAGDDKKAQQDVDFVLNLQPRNAGATYLNAVLMVRAARYADAMVELQKLGPVVSRFPRAFYFEALAAANLGQTEVAVDFANKYVARMPADADGVRLLARTQLTAKRPERAVEALTKAISAGQDDAQTLDLLGRAYTMMGKRQDAVAALTEATKLAPDNAQMLTHLASSQMQQGDPAAAEKSLEKSAEIAPNLPNSGEALVAAALSAGDLDKADQALASLRSRVGETEAVDILTGMVKLGHLDLEGGRAAFAEALKQYPNSINAKLNLAKVLILQNRRSEGEALLREILAKDPANLPTLTTFIQIMASASTYQPAIEAVEAAKAAAPANKAFTAMESDLIVRSGDPRRAVAMLLALRGAEPLPPVLLGALARAQVAAGLTEDAKKTYRDILDVVPGDLDARRAQIDLLLREKDIDGARASLNDALKIAPGNIGLMQASVQLEARTAGLDAALKRAAELRDNPANLPASAVLKGDTLMIAKKYPEAAQAFVDEYKAQPTGPLAIRAANAYASAGNDDAATKVLAGWQADHPDDADAAQLQGLLALKTKRNDDAQKHFETVLAKRPSDTVALNNLAWLLQIKGDPRARTLAQRAYLQAPSPETGDTLGWIMVKQGDYKAAIPLLQQSAKQRPQDFTVQYHLAMALNDNGQPGEAIKVLQPTVAATAQFDEKPAAQKLLTELTLKNPSLVASPANDTSASQAPAAPSSAPRAPVRAPGK